METKENCDAPGYYAAGTPETKRSSPLHAISADAVRDWLAIAHRDVRAADQHWRAVCHEYRAGGQHAARPPTPSVALCLEAQEAAAAAEVLTILAGDWAAAARWGRRRVLWARRALAVVASEVRFYPADPPPWLDL